MLLGLFSSGAESESERSGYGFGNAERSDSCLHQICHLHERSLSLRICSDFWTAVARIAAGKGRSDADHISAVGNQSAASDLSAVIPEVRS